MDSPQNAMMRRDRSLAVNGRPPPSWMSVEKITHGEPLFIGMGWTIAGRGKARADMATNRAHTSSSEMAMEPARKTQRAKPSARIEAARKSQ